MNKKLISLLCIGFALSLSSCGNASSQGKPSDTGSKGSDTTDTGADTNTDTDTKPAEDRYLLEEFYSNLSVHSGIVTAEGFSKTTLYSEKAVYVEYLGEYADEYDSYGLIVNGDQGTYEFTFNHEGRVEYGQIVDRNTDGSTIYNSLYTLMDIEQTDPDSWDYLTPTTYTTTDLDLLDLMCFLDGWSYALGEYVENPLLTIDPEAFEVIFTGYLNLEEEYGTDEYNENIVLTISDLGLSNNYVDDALDNPVEQSGLSEGYSDELIDAMHTYLNDALPSFNWSKESGWKVDEENAQVNVFDYTIGCKVDDMVTALVNDGWTLDESLTERYSGYDEDEWEYIDWEDGDEDYFYSVTVYKEQSLGEGVLAYIDYVDVIYCSSDYYNDYYETIGYEDCYPNGAFRVAMHCTPIYTYEELCNEVRTLEFADGFMLEGFGFTVDPINFKFANGDDYGWLYGCDYYYRTYSGTFVDQATAFAQVAVAEAYLVELGFVAYEGYEAANIATNGYAILDKTFEDDSILELQFVCDANGGITIELLY